MQNLMFIAVGVTVSVALWIWRPVDLAVDNAFVFGDWRALDFRQLMLIGGLGILFAAANMLAALAYQRGPASAVATFDYTYLIFSIGWGFWWLAETPDAPALLGMTLIAVAGILALTKRNSGWRK